jgi:hypothetical protein
MHAAADNTISARSRQAAIPAHSPAGKLITTWSQRRRQFTPWAFRHLRAVAVTRLAVGIFLVGVGAMLISLSHDRWDAIPLAGAALLLAIGSLDMSAARYASRRG